MVIPNLPQRSVCGSFSYALHEFGQHALGVGDPRHYRPDRDKSGLCIVFGPSESSGQNDVQHLNAILENPRLPGWVANGHHQLWVVQRRRQTVVAANPTLVPKLAKAPAGGGLGVLYKENGVWKRRAWQYMELYKYCYNLEKLGSNCARCPNNGLECIYDSVASWAQHHNVNSDPLLPSKDPEFIRIDDWETEDIEGFLREVSKGTPWTFVNPRFTVAHPFAPRLLSVCEMEFTAVSENREELRDKAKRAARTRKAVKRCKECFFQELCDWCETPYHGRPYDCQNKENKGRYGFSVPGPYSEEQAYDAAQSFWYNLPHIEREKIEFIAYNAGISTYIFGHELRLGKMTAEMDGVEFFRPTTHERRQVDFDEAVLLCTTPYRHNGKYEYPGFGKPPRPMTDEEFYTYVEVCQHRWIRNRGYKQPSAPEILSIEWNPDSYYTFESETDSGFGLNFTDIRSIMKYNGGLPKTVGVFMRSREEVEKCCPETSSDKQS